jgi:uncharacterized protein (TIGR02246 family)
MKETEDQVRQVSAKWLELATKRDVSGIMQLMAADVVFYRPNKMPYVGFEAVSNQVTEDYAQNPKAIYNWKTTRLIVTGALDYAIEYGTFHETGLGQDGSKEDQGAYITVYRKEQDSWKVLSDMSCLTDSVPEVK